MESVVGEGGFVTRGHGQNPRPEEVKCKQKEAHTMRRSHLREKSEEKKMGGVGVFKKDKNPGELRPAGR